MSYNSQANVWPTAYEADGVTAQPTIGKYSGERYVGNIAGVTCATSGEGRMVWEFDGNDFADAEGKALSIPEGYARITSVLVQVDEALAAGDVDVEVGGATVLTGPVAIDGAVGIFDGVLIATDATLTVSSAEDVTIDVTGATAAAAGKVKVIVEFTRV